MESPKQVATNKKWKLCSIAGFLGLFFLVFCTDQRRRNVLLEPLESLGRPQSGSLPTTEQVVSTVNVSVELRKAHSCETAAATAETMSPPPPISSSCPQPGAATEPDSHQLPHVLEVPSPPPSEDSPPQPARQSEIPAASEDEEGGSLAEGKCDIYEGRWVYDPETYPLYHAGQCPFLSDQVSCQRNGRPDSRYEHWRWQPGGCDVPRRNVGASMLETLRGKRVVIVGDSLNRNQWESLACLLYSSVHNPSRAVVKDGVFRALDYNCTVEFYWSPFLVSLEMLDSGKKVIKLENLPASAKRWLNADVMVFNTGHWWTHKGRFRSWDFYERGGELVQDMDMNTALEMGLRTWARWVDQRVDPTKTRVFFRSISPEHNGEHRCHNQTHPITNETYVQRLPSSMVSIVEKTIRQMKTPVRYLNITRLSEYRRDAHASVYATAMQMELVTEEQRRQLWRHADCSHWCLPGLPDTWNVLLYASIIDNP